MNIIEVKTVSKIYQEGGAVFKAIDSITLNIVKGEVLLIMGPSGSGKTTLLSMMGCILSPTAGEIRVNGQLVSGLKKEALPDIRRSSFGFVFQSFNLFSSLTAAQNVEAVLRLKGWDKRTVRKQALNLLEKVDMLKRADFFPKDMSGGEKQRVAFARALAGDPPIILADEPTANLDSKTGAGVLGLLRELAGSGKAVCFVSHDPKAEAFSDRVVFLEDGKLKA